MPRMFSTPATKFLEFYFSLNFLFVFLAPVINALALAALKFY
jgi:hypothetical protein